MRYFKENFCSDNITYNVDKNLRQYFLSYFKYLNVNWPTLRSRLVSNRYFCTSIYARWTAFRFCSSHSLARITKRPRKKRKEVRNLVMLTSATISTFHVFDFNQCNLIIDKWTLTIFRCANITTSFPGYIKTFWRLDGAQCQKEIKSPGNEVANINIKIACVMWRQTLKLAVLSKYISTKIIFVWIFAQLCPLYSYRFLDAVQLSKNKKKTLDLRFCPI